MFLLIQTLPTFWAERIWILRILIFLYFLGSQISGLGPLGPSLGPPTWAPRGPPHLGPGAAGAGAAGAGRILRSQPDPSPNAPRDQLRRTEPGALAATSKTISRWSHPWKYDSQVPKTRTNTQHPLNPHPFLMRPPLGAQDLMPRGVVSFAPVQ